MRRGAKFVSFFLFPRRIFVLIFRSPLSSTRKKKAPLQRDSKRRRVSRRIEMHLSVSVFCFPFRSPSSLNAHFSRVASIIFGTDGHHCPRGPTCSRQHCAFNDEVNSSFLVLLSHLLSKLTNFCSSRAATPCRPIASSDSPSSLFVRFRQPLFVNLFAARVVVVALVVDNGRSSSISIAISTSINRWRSHFFLFVLVDSSLLLTTSGKTTNEAKGGGGRSALSFTLDDTLPAARSLSSESCPIFIYLAALARPGPPRRPTFLFISILRKNLHLHFNLHLPSRSRKSRSSFFSSSFSICSSS